jgi:hypothetical protein
MQQMPRVVVVLCAIFAAFGARAQSVEKPWKYSASISYYDLPKYQDYWNPVVTADRGQVHLEGRYNYLNIHCGSFWAGANFSTGKTWKFDATLMFGLVVGTIQGVGPGFELSLNHSWFSLTSEGEYVFEIQKRVDNTSYSWTEVSGSPASWCRLGLALQLTNALVATRNIQRGPLIAFTFKNVEFEADVLDPDRADATYTLSLTLSF